MGELIAVASYARTSETVRQGDDRGVRDQHRINKVTCAARGMTVLKPYTDSGRSASRPGTWRPGFEELLVDLDRGVTAEGGGINGIVCVADDRLYRRVEDYARFVAAFTRHGDRVYVHQAGLRDLYSKEGFLDGAASVQLAARETEVRSRRVTNWHWSRAVDGLPHSGPRPFGWAEDRMALHPTESVLLRTAIMERISGRPVNQITADWLRLGVRGTRGAAPKSQTTTQMMTAPRVCGYRANRGKIVRDPETGEPVVGEWATLVSPQEWQAVCATFSPGSTYLHRGSGAPRVTGAASQPRYLASGLLTCGRRVEGHRMCGAKLGGRRQPTSRRSPYVYCCHSSNGRGCGRCAISGPLVDQVIGLALFSDEYKRPIRLPESLAHRWRSGGVDLLEKRSVISRAFSTIVVRPGVKGDHGWDWSRVSPVWREDVACLADLG